MTTTSDYYNAKPSNVGNLGSDLAGAHRMRFDTYETDAEKAERKAHTKQLKQLKEVRASLKTAILSGAPDYQEIIRLYDREFELKFGFSPEPDSAEKVIAARRAEARKGGLDEQKAFNSMVRAYNQVHRNTRGLDSETYRHYKLEKLRRKYRPKAKPVGETCGKRFSWKDFDAVEAHEEDIKYLEANSKAVQFGNSVSDKERVYIVKKLSEFIAAWKNDSIFKHVDISPVGWSFGARGKPNSVAYYQPAGQVISVNRDNIGSLIHELGHFIDHQKGNVSDKISRETAREYRESLQGQGLSSKQLAYYCSKKEIFARAFEAYCYKVKAGFDSFAQWGEDYLPELNNELLELVSECFRSAGHDC